ncbi:MAG: hypothetical protein GX946_01200 [Oligosphaeraceae bacterium]|nr:hypothetical protein [Oligosphaeraceae bacterium]
MQSIDKKINNFLNKHRVFNTFELEKSCGVSGYHTRNVLSKLQRENKIKKVRNGIYTVLPENAHDDFTPPALLIAAKMTSDAVLGYRSALAFYGLSRSATSSHTFISKHRIKPHHIHGMLFKPCLPPKQVTKGENIGIVEHVAWNTPVRVVSKERLLADSLDRLDLSGGWEEVLNAFRYENALNWKKLLAYLCLLANPATSARVGYFLEQCRKTMEVREDVLLQLEKMKPRIPQHFFRSRRIGKLNHRWNLYIPVDVAAAITNEKDYAF